jgi:hypothetical protein
MITALTSLRRNCTRMIRRINEHSKQVATIRMQNFSDIKGVPSEHSFWKHLLVPIYVDVC